ncbi:MAG TPA: hypothetical protein VGA89_01770 [Patescibacteria group bacterium]|jgi:hypothetical protein
MIKKIAFITLIISLALVSWPTVVSAQNYFAQLENLHIGEALPTVLRQSAEDVDDNNPETTYLRFESASFAYPHYVEINQANQIIYLELEIPATHLEEYRNYLDSLGEPEVERERTQSLVFLGWPSQGVGFIVAHTSPDFMLFTRYPIKTVVELVTNEAKNFTPVSQVNNAPPALAQVTPTPIPLATKPLAGNWDFLATPAALTIIGTVVVGIIATIVIYKKSA